jgi:hypothetical protein
VESVRTARGSRQRAVAYLGQLKRGERSGWARLGRRLDRPDRPEAQKVLLNRLGLTLPRRLRYLEEVAPLS